MEIKGVATKVIELKKNLFWSSLQHQRDFLDSFAKDSQIKRPEEWGKITIKQFSAKGGLTILNHHKGSLFKALKNIYDGIIVHA